MFYLVNLTGMPMGKKISSIGFVILLIALVLYLAGNTLWIGFSALGFLAEIIGWGIAFEERRKKRGS